VDIWLNPWPEADGRAFQIVQSLLAFAAGGVFGQGVGQGSPYYIPVVHSDFVFAALAEEWGLLGVVVPFVGVFVAIVLLWNSWVDATDIAILVVMYLITAVGVTVGFHRLLTHRAFQTYPWLERVFAVMGSLSVQGSVMDWVADHRKHHAHTDREGDPHSPHVGHDGGARGVLAGLWHAHTGWLLSTQGRADWKRHAPDLYEDRGMRLISRHFGWLTLAGLAIPAAAGYLVSGSSAGALTGLLWGGLVRIFFVHHITKDHAQLAAAAAGRMGPAAARVRQLAIWLISFAAAMTPLPFLGLACAATVWRQASTATRVALVTALSPIGVYLVQGLVLGEFEPLPRFAIAPGAVLLPLVAAEVMRRWGSRSPAVLLGLTVGLAVAFSATLEVLAFARPGRSWSGAECLGPLTRLDAEDRALADFLRAHRRPEEGVFIDPLGFTDIVIIEAAGIPPEKAATLSSTRTPSATLAETRARTAASWFAAHDESWGRTPIPDWPSDGARFGGWRVAHYWPGRAPGGYDMRPLTPAPPR